MPRRSLKRKKDQANNSTDCVKSRADSDDPSDVIILDFPSTPFAWMFDFPNHPPVIMTETIHRKTHPHASMPTIKRACPAVMGKHGVIHQDVSELSHDPEAHISVAGFGTMMSIHISRSDDPITLAAILSEPGYYNQDIQDTPYTRVMGIPLSDDQGSLFVEMGRQFAYMQAARCVTFKMASGGELTIGRECTLLTSVGIMTAIKLLRYIDDRTRIRPNPGLISFDADNPPPVGTVAHGLLSLVGCVAGLGIDRVVSAHETTMPTCRIIAPMAWIAVNGYLARPKIVEDIYNY